MLTKSIETFQKQHYPLKRGQSPINSWQKQFLRYE